MITFFVFTRQELQAHSMLNLAFGKVSDLGDTFLISDIGFQYSGDISPYDGAIV